MLVIKAKIQNILARIANREDPDQTASLDCLFRSFWQAASVQDFRTFTVQSMEKNDKKICWKDPVLSDWIPRKWAC